MNWRLLLIAPLLVACPATDEGEGSTDPSLGGVSTDMSTRGSDSSGSTGEEDTTPGTTSGGGECAYECDGIACNMTCMGESIWLCNSDNMWELLEDCAMGEVCQLVGPIFECVEPGGDGDGDPGDGGDCVTVSTTEPPLVPMGPYGACHGLDDCIVGFNTCIDNQCSESCTSDADCPPAPGYEPECVLLDFDSTCFLTCSESADCPGGLVCCNGRCNWP